jgi:hypothetical protein
LKNVHYNLAPIRRAFFVELVLLSWRGGFLGVGLLKFASCVMRVVDILFGVVIWGGDLEFGLGKLNLCCWSS